MCVYFLILACFAVLEASAMRQCDNLGVLLYDDMHCKPNFDKPGGCPSSYDCPDIKKSDHSCYFRGKSIEYGHGLNTSTFCNVGCVCNKRDTDMEITCAILDCGDYGPPPPPGCYRTYDLTRCCGSLDCPPPNKPIHRCTYDGVEYQEGERFAPKGTCSLCLCQKGFKGKIEEPFCIPHQCETQIGNQDKIQNACAPVYTRQSDIKDGVLCCPTFYTCPDRNEVVEGNPTSSNQCRYGEKFVKVGQEFKKQAKNYYEVYNVTCKCNIPPLMTCVAAPRFPNES